MWLHKAVKSMIRSLTDWLPRSEIVSDDLHQSVLRLARACSILDADESDRSKNSWICFVEFAVSNLVIGEYYNLGNKVKSKIIGYDHCNFDKCYSLIEKKTFYSFSGLDVIHFDCSDWKM